MLTDAGPILAFLDADDANHNSAIQALRDHRVYPMITTLPCFTEAMHLLGRNGGYNYQSRLWRLHQDNSLFIHPQLQRELPRMRELMAQYRDTPMDLGDASLVAAAETLNLSAIFTFDRHFHAYRLANGTALTVVPGNRP